jgi:hypothetical protein
MPLDSGGKRIDIDDSAATSATTTTTATTLSTSASSSSADVSESDTAGATSNQIDGPSAWSSSDKGDFRAFAVQLGEQFAALASALVHQPEHQVKPCNSALQYEALEHQADHSLLDDDGAMCIDGTGSSSSSSLAIKIDRRRRGASDKSQARTMKRRTSGAGATGAAAATAAAKLSTLSTSKAAIASVPAATVDGGDVQVVAVPEQSNGSEVAPTSQVDESLLLLIAEASSGEVAKNRMRLEGTTSAETVVAATTTAIATTATLESNIKVEQQDGSTSVVEPTQQCSADDTESAFALVDLSGLAELSALSEPCATPTPTPTPTTPAPTEQPSR